ncbi:hypothetical protein VTL71DRAFT_748 [Oculimacula yallundae]|uniref:Uncharacterized protein n=1 Tax=Oculimacula yallundae TaxID=86028 RepID=A0ABR4D0X8_9HELO
MFFPKNPFHSVRSTMETKNIAQESKKQQESKKENRNRHFISLAARLHLCFLWSHGCVCIKKLVLNPSARASNKSKKVKML